MARFPNFKTTKKSKSTPVPVTSDDNLHCGTIEEDSGDRWLSSGDLVKALRFYNRALEYYSTAQRLIPSNNTLPTTTASNSNSRALFDSQYNIARLYFSIWQQLIETGNWQESATTIELMQQLGFNVPTLREGDQDIMNTDSIWAMIIEAYERALEYGSVDLHPVGQAPRTWDLLVNYGYVMLSVCEESMEDCLDSDNSDDARIKSLAKISQAGELACEVLVKAHQQECIEMDTLGDFSRALEPETMEETDVSQISAKTNAEEGENFARAEESATAVSAVETLVAHLRVINIMFTVSGLATISEPSESTKLGLQNFVQRGDTIVRTLQSKWFDQLPLGEREDPYHYNLNCKLDAIIAITQWQSQKIKVETIHASPNIVNIPNGHMEVLNKVKNLWDTTAVDIPPTSHNLWYMAAADSLIDVPPLSTNWSSYTQADAMLSKAQKATPAKDQVTLARIMVARAEVFKSQINLGGLNADLEALVVRFRPALVANVRAYANAVLGMSFLSGSVAEAKRAKREANELVQWTNALL
ncbi:hypothetical protein NADFUDRAFT_42302 [Nadsonia fulvescens var. elongata DSM 6958]|uniref:Uncharacterized protein n=1 Tax=Nadsonia fulvescens var. elongata DSM 6958 TaxID=857566 RepID=A0A1E3PJA0_9ASCO|nr:hypothetical protein NADFUDRAFT_42302 [Nadsonia fulvescens var. elongata DSM 6958]